MQPLRFPFPPLGTGECLRGLEHMLLEDNAVVGQGGLPCSYEDADLKTRGMIASSAQSGM